MWSVPRSYKEDNWGDQVSSVRGVSVKRSEYNFHKYKFVRLSTPIQLYDRAIHVWRTVKIKQGKHTNFVNFEHRTTKHACKKWDVYYVTTKFRTITMLCNSWQRKIHKCICFMTSLYTFCTHSYNASLSNRTLDVISRCHHIVITDCRELKTMKLGSPPVAQQSYCFMEMY
jgi:hypothetical protein